MRVFLIRGGKLFPEIDIDYLTVFFFFQLFFTLPNERPTKQLKHCGLHSVWLCLMAAKGPAWSRNLLCPKSAKVSKILWHIQTNASLQSQPGRIEVCRNWNLWRILYLWYKESITMLYLDLHDNLEIFPLCNAGMWNEQTRSTMMMDMFNYTSRLQL